MEPIVNMITNEETAGEGYKLTAILGFWLFQRDLVCIFQADPREPPLPVETMFSKAPVADDGYQGLYAELQQQACEKGFPLCCAIDFPPVWEPSKQGKEKEVQLVCQRRQGQPSGSRIYQIVNCPITTHTTNQVAIEGFMPTSLVDPRTRSTAASMPTLLQTLQTYSSQGYKVASIYNPRIGDQAAKCHIIFEKTDFQYSITVIDIDLERRWIKGDQNDKVYHRELFANHDQYRNPITQFVEQGWELAGLIDMGDSRPTGKREGPCREVLLLSTIKLIFQAKTSMPADAAASPPAAAASPPAAAASSPISVQCPEGAAPGATIQLTHPSTGQVIQVQVPEGVKPGDTFMVSI